MNVDVPPTLRFGYATISLLGRHLKGTALLGTHSYALDFLNIPPAPDVEIGTIVPPSSSTNGAPFKITVTNNGTLPSTAKPLKVTLVDYADGPVGPYYTQSATIPVLQPGQSKTFTFYLQNPDGYDTDGTITIGTYGQADYRKQEVSF